ncbi:MAG: restriction endonuclease subunit S [Chlorobi bacterium]|nr:restriction endonuclease subunit S [Chlorobiota bacterium]
MSGKIKYKEDWIEIKLEEACQILDNLRKPINAKERLKRTDGKKQSELFPYYGATGKVGYIDDYLTDGEYVLLGEDGAPFNDFRKNIAYIINGKTWVNNHAHILLSHFNNKFLCHYLNQFQYNEYVSGTTRLKLTQGKLKTIPVQIPPLPEQRAIVSKIETLFSELDSAIENLKTAQEQLKIYRQAVLKKAFEGELTKEWRKKQTDLPSADELLEQIKKEKEAHYEKQLKDWKQAVKKWEETGKKGKKPAKPKKLKELPPLAKEELKDLPKLPANFVWTRLGDLIWSVKDGPHYSPKYTEDGIPFISGRNIHPTGINFSDAKYISKELHNELSKRCKPELNDVLYTKGGTTGIARVNTYDIDFNVWVHVAVLKSVNSVYPFYLQHVLNSNHCYRQSQKYTHGVGNQDLGLTRMILITIPFCSLDEQTQIVQEIETRLSVADKMQETIAESIKKAEALRQSILKKAFEGRLLSEVEVNECKNAPDYEPAEKLLARIEQSRNKKIKAEKEIKKQNGKRKPKNKNK